MSREPSVTRLEMTEEVRAAVRASGLARTSSRKRRYWIAFAAMCAFLIWFTASIWGFIIYGALAIGSLAAVGRSIWLTWLDLHGPSYLRASGVIRATPHVAADEPLWYTIDVGRWHLLNPYPDAPPFVIIDDGSIDFLTRSGIVLSIRDNDGSDAYVRAGYRPASAVIT